MHMTCTGITRETADDLLAEAAQAGIRSILVLRGDPLPSSDGKWEATAGGFENAGELVAHIRRKHGTFFSIAVAGHPLGHPSSSSRAEELAHLKAKVDAGADYIITQMFFQAAAYTSYVHECRAVGIACPIVPGILMVPPSIEALRQITSHCGVSIPEALEAEMVAAAPDAEAVRKAGRAYMQKLCEQVLGSADYPAPGLYIYTLNLEKSVTELIENLNLSGQATEDEAVQRELPFARPRNNEKVRPIFWASNPVSYLARTRGWVDEMPQRWNIDVVNRDGAQDGATAHGGGAGGGRTQGLVIESPPVFDQSAGGGARGQGADGVVYSYHSIVARRLGSHAERRSMWGETLTAEEDVFDVFERFVRGYVPRLPWCERLEGETTAAGLLKPLAALNHHGYLTINSQPRVNAMPSDDAAFGWGPAGGHVFQKAYLEFFCSPARLDRLLAALDADGSGTITVRAFNAQGQCRGRRCAASVKEPGSGHAGGELDRHVMCVTWGVFDGSQILQPTVVDSHMFEVWKDEAFELWRSGWGSIYPAESAARKVVHEMAATYWHVYMVDNNFIDGDLYKVFWSLLQLDPCAGSPVILPKKPPAA
jgi:methylenetetrahydrofolate reductase (NADPH)